MGAKFIVDRRCPVKTTLTLTGLIEAIKHRGLLRKINELAAAGNCSFDPELKLDMVLPETGLSGGMTVRELHSQTQALMQHRITCRQCPSSLSGHVGGCIVYVPYPLSEGVEYLLWVTAVKGLQGDLPEAVLPGVKAFAERARLLTRTPFAEGMKARGDILGLRPRVYQNGPVWQRVRLTSAQVLETFFVNGVLAGQHLRIFIDFLTAALAVARAMEPALRNEERRQALLDDIQPYQEALELMLTAREQGLGVYVWP